MNIEQIKVFKAMRSLLQFAIDQTLFYKFRKRLTFPIVEWEQNQISLMLSMQSNSEEDFDNMAVAFAETIFTTFGNDMLYHPIFCYDERWNCPNCQGAIVSLIKNMDTIMTHLNDENLLDSWIDLEENEDEDIIKFYASNEEEYRKVEKLFFDLMKQAGLDDGSEFGKNVFTSNKSDLDFKKWIWCKVDNYYLAIKEQVRQAIINSEKEIEIRARDTFTKPAEVRESSQEMIFRYLKMLVGENPCIETIERANIIIDHLNTYLAGSNAVCNKIERITEKK